MNAPDRDSAFTRACDTFWVTLQCVSEEAKARLSDIVDPNAPKEESNRPAPLGWVP